MKTDLGKHSTKGFLSIKTTPTASHSIINSVLLSFLPHLLSQEARVFMHSSVYSYIHIALFHVHAESNFM